MGISNNSLSSAPASNRYDYERPSKVMNIDFNISTTTLKF